MPCVLPPVAFLLLRVYTLFSQMVLPAAISHHNFVESLT